MAIKRILISEKFRVVSECFSRVGTSIFLCCCLVVMGLDGFLHGPCGLFRFSHAGLWTSPMEPPKTTYSRFWWAEEAPSTLLKGVPGGVSYRSCHKVRKQVYVLSDWFYGHVLTYNPIAGPAEQNLNLAPRLWNLFDHARLRRAAVDVGSLFIKFNVWKSQRLSGSRQKQFPEQ